MQVTTRFACDRKKLHPCSLRECLALLRLCTELLTQWPQQVLIPVRMQRRFLQQRVRDGGELGMAVRAAENVGDTHLVTLRVFGIRPQSTAGDGDLAQIEPQAGASGATLGHEQTRLHGAKPLKVALGPSADPLFQKRFGRPSQKRHPGLARGRIVGGIGGAGVVMRVQHAGRKVEPCTV